MAMADLSGAAGIASRRARAQVSQPPSPVADVGKCKQLRLLFARPQLFLAMPTLLRGNGRTLPYAGRAAITSAAQGHAQGALWTRKKNVTVRLVEPPAHDGDLVAMCMMSVGSQCGGCVCGRCACDVHAWMPCRLGHG